MDMKPCPFCGCDRVTLEETESIGRDDFGEVYRYACVVFCPVCGGRGGRFSTYSEKLPDETKRRAVFAWSKRA